MVIAYYFSAAMGTHLRRGVSDPDFQDCPLGKSGSPWVGKHRRVGVRHGAVAYAGSLSVAPETIFIREIDILL